MKPLNSLHLLKRFWFTFDSLPKHHPLVLGCGVTAYDYNDAVQLMSQSVFKEEPIADISTVVENVDLSALDQGHVIPNMEPAVWRGVWFPKGHRLL